MINNKKVGDKVWTCLASFETLGYEIDAYSKPHEVIIVSINGYYIKTQKFDQNNNPDDDINATYGGGPEYFFNTKEEANNKYKQIVTYKIKELEETIEELKKELNTENK